jgi:predicted amidohydrolase YtcJ
MPSTSWLLHDVDVDGRMVDCRLDGGRIAEVGPDIPAAPGDRVLDGGGGALLPGLADHHIHLLATAAAATSLDLGGGTDLSVLGDQPGAGWLRVIGAGVELRRQDVDLWCADRPVRVQHRSAALWTLNSEAVAILGPHLSIVEQSTGQLWRDDKRLGDLLHHGSVPDLRGLGRRLAAYGVTHVTDATPELDSVALLARELPQHVLSLAAAGDGPRKIVLADHVPVPLDDVIDRIRAAHDAGRPVAVHAVTQQSLALVIAALGAAGTVAGDRVEHAAVCDDRAAAALAELGVTVVTQPTLLTRHGVAYRRDSDVADRPFLWRYASLCAAGIPVAVSSDAPYGDADPWHTVRAAARRVLADGTVLSAVECVPPEVVLRSLTAQPRQPAGPARRIVRGAPADLCLLRDSLSATVDRVLAGGPALVRATFVSGLPIHLDTP